MPATVTPYLTCTPATEAIEFYKKAFGAVADEPMALPDGQVMHAQITIDGAVLYLADNMSGADAPSGTQGITLHLQVDDCDAVFERAIDAGCIVLMPLEDQFWGDRYGQLQDPYGHTWGIATTKQEMTPEQMQAAMAQMAQQ